MERTQQGESNIRRYFSEVGELRSRSDAEFRARSLIRKGTEAHHDFRAGQQLELALQERAARVAFTRLGFVAGWCTFHGRRHPRVDEGQAIVGTLRRRLVRKPCTVHRAKQPIAAAIAGEHTTCAIRPVRCWRQPEHHDRCRRITEARYWPTPICVVTVRRALGDRDARAPLDQPRARSTFNDLCSKLLESQPPQPRRFITLGKCHPANSRPYSLRPS